ncbi:hypothetical protein [Natronocalculus amylovorans]|uniref:Uncharacterized protein n=1 Tax=Natronocalculus amylovorans TaxID=2917812 RepID=A0AAE3G178_9EURY|nr:hypothetical protein [Natronocalculus amylovorans]MCL9818375.1 hypothetical protein [Natronocalculus amylovorans]
MATARTISARMSGTQKLMLEALAYDHADASQAAVLREFIIQGYSQVFGNIDPVALAEKITPEQKQRIIQGEDPRDVVDDEYLLEDLRTCVDREDGQELVSDGGAKPHPSSYTVTPGPSDLGCAGPAYTWDQLKNAVSDDGHWSEELDIHPNRVRQSSLKQSHKYTSRVVVGILRSQSYDGLVTRELLDDVIEEYLVPFHDRVDDAAGRKYIFETYEPLITEHLYESPAPGANAYYTTEEKQLTVAENLYQEAIETPDAIDRIETLFDPDAYLNAVGKVKNKRTIGQWYEALGEFMESLAPCAAILESTDATKLAVEHPTTFNHAEAYLKATLAKWSTEFIVLPHAVQEGVLDTMEYKYTIALQDHI